ncbi:ABC transporter ATP-binding protein [Clostridium felsineum]|uniref:Multidrug resistance ABC transporter ATP-binding/permease protein YheH n=1 Tax=Clostridium felsineum TaxID=36839 RepID=A0A1S8KYN2_9CLOT|nr:ABC transporter ATP-binding protein [Clostridium felsineum]URZ07818.1 putative multidrug resistance ABC transporter ATP-binding/permease protein YheH [Clostridium felsineum]URZ12849.1 putative multidrug resistance ABC transporter ATP-binding/permease protein YheH [Clostridium felsineum]
MISTKNNMKTENKLKSIKRLLLLTLPYKKKIFLSIICVLLVNSAELLKPYILKVSIDDFLVGRKVQTGFHSITSMGILYFIVVALGGFFSISEANLINSAAQSIMKNLRGSVFKTIQLLPLSYLDKTSSGSLITRATNDVEALSEMYTDVIISLFQDIFLLIGIIYAMLSLNIKLSLVSFSVIPVMFILIFSLKTKIKRNFKRMKSLIGKINGFMAESLSGMKLIQIFTAEKEKRIEFKALNNEYFNATLFQVRLNSILRPASNIFQNLSIALLLWYSVDKIANHTLQIGVLYAFTSYIRQFFDPISDLADNYTTIQSALVSADRIFELLDKKNILENLDAGIPIKKLNGTVEFKNVWFSYDNKNFILKDLNFKIDKGETAAFVGETGAGKTTIISLISGFYKVQKGEILIDGININSIRPSDLRKNVAVVLQDVFLFSGNIKDNITLNDKISDTLINSAIESSMAKNFIEKMPRKLDEPVMERGKTFSAGQKQLLSFARAIAHDPSIFVLDEATANIDTHTEKLIQKAIENITRDKTTFIIAHRLSTIRNADKILVIKNGELSEIGTHDELMKKGGYYKTLVEEGKN